MSHHKSEDYKLSAVKYYINLITVVEFLTYV